MKKLFLFVCVVILGLNSQAQLVDVIVEEFGTAGGDYPAGYMTYRVFARLQDSEDFLAGVYGVGATPGDPDHSMCFGRIPGFPEEVSIWNSVAGAVAAEDINSVLCGFFPEVCYDSYITVGGGGFLIDYLSWPPGQFDPIFDEAPLANGGCIEEGVYYSFDGGFGTGTDNRVLIMQVTCPIGQLKFAINVYVYNDGNSQDVIYYCHTMEGEAGVFGGVAETPFPCMGLVYPVDYECPGCNDPIACNYDPFTIGGGECFYAPDCDVAVGCTDAGACNYEPEAIWDFYNECTYPGCNDPVACNYDEFAGCDDGSCGYVSGCMQVGACNYNSEAVCPTTCTWPGCMDVMACNFNPAAGCDDGSCYWPGSNFLLGTLYFDANGDNIWNQGFFDEESVGLGSLYIQELDLTLFPNSEGEFYSGNFPFGTYTVTYSDPNGVYEMNDGAPLTMTLPSCNELFVPLDALSSSMLQVSGPCCIWMMDIHCQNGFNPGLWVNNLGSVPLNGTFTMTFDPVLVPSYLWGTVPYDEYADGVMTWNINDQAPGSSLLYQCHINGPGVDFIGDVFPFNMELVLYDDEGNIFYQNSWVLEPTVVCAYDPNDKYTAEPGYTEEHHFVPQEDEIEYRVRFQNTGNFPAETVVIRDTLDLDHLDLQSFYPVFASHSFSTCVEANGAVTFTFNNIMLPDSTTDEPGSQGYVVYRVRPHSGVEHMDVIHNTAYIFFDGNPPIVTNTTWHTIMDCNELGTITGPDMICEGEMAEFTFPDDYVDSINWTINEESSGSGSPLMYNADTPGEYVVGVTVINPLCEISQNTDLEVNPLPGITIIQSDGTLTAPDGASWQWYYEDAELIGETDQTLSPEYNGYYTVLTTSGDGCTSLAEIIFIGTSELSASDFRLYPNPVSDIGRFDMPGHGSYVLSLYDASGKRVRTWNTADSSEWLDFSDLAAGSYNLILSANGSAFGPVPVVVAR